MLTRLYEPPDELPPMQRVRVSTSGPIDASGQSDVRATEHLNALNQRGPTPWELSFSFGRALQAPALKAWSGNASNVAAAQQALHRRAQCNSAARLGQYTEAMESH